MSIKYRIENCQYDLVKDLLNCFDSSILDVQRIDQGVIVTMQEGKSKDDLLAILNLDPLAIFCQKTTICSI